MGQEFATTNIDTSHQKADSVRWACTSASATSGVSVPDILAMASVGHPTLPDGSIINLYFALI